MTDRKTLLREIQQLHFMMIETALYLNVQNECTEALENFCEYQRKYKEVKEKYESCYGPLSYNGVDVKNDGWSWVCGPWPWEGEC